MTEHVEIGGQMGSMARPAPSRSCAGCDLCCTAASVAEIGKPAGVRCPSLTALRAPGTNCMIYEHRPGVCRSFMCIWRASDVALDDAFFPADCGFCLWVNDPFVWPMTITVGYDPKRPTAWDRPHFRARFKALAWELNCIVAIGQGELATHIFAPSGKVFAKAKRPDLFIDGGKQVGLPGKEFRAGVRLTVAEIAKAILGYASR